MARKPKTATEAAAAPVPVPETITAWKGFDREMKCRGFAYVVGETYRTEAKIVRCAAEGGFHSCEMPLDTWNYYGPADSRYAEVVAGGSIARGDANDDSKFASAEITIKAEIKLPAVIKAAVDWVLARATGNTATGDSGHAAATGYSGHAAATGNRGHAAATGYRGHAAATGKHSIAASLGPDGAAKAGDDGWIVLAAWRWTKGGYELLQVRTAKVGGPEGIKAGVTYRLTEACEFEGVE